MINTKILALAFSALIVRVDAQVTCTSSSPQCCWVVRSWQLMGQSVPTGISPNDNSCCTKPMAGVTCDSTKTQVTRIEWSSMNLVSLIPSDIGNYLPNLGWLVLSKNVFLTGPIPKEIGKLSNLQRLDLSENSLTGSIPKEIGNLTDLRLLYLNRNLLIGSIPKEIGNLTRLQELWLGTNNLTGNIPLETFKLTNLVRLSLLGNQFSGSIPPHIGNLTRLRYILLSFNKLTGTIPSTIGNLVNLTQLYLDTNLLTGTFRPNCDVDIVNVQNTQVTLCGCVTSRTPSSIFPSSITPRSCLATGSTSSMAKRAFVLSQSIVPDRFTCNKDDSNNPFQDCLNLQAAICNSSYIKGNSARISTCKNSVDTMFRSLSSVWRDVRKYCGQWSFDGAVKGSSTSQSCTNANNALQADAKYSVMVDGVSSSFSVTAALTDSVKQFLWGNTEIK